MKSDLLASSLSYKGEECKHHAIYLWNEAHRVILNMDAMLGPTICPGVLLILMKKPRIFLFGKHYKYLLIPVLELRLELIPFFSSDDSGAHGNSGRGREY